MNFVERREKSMSNYSRHHNTYMVFAKRGRGFSKLIGPVFEREIDGIKKRFFKDKKATVCEELAFKSMYPNRYAVHIQKFWLDKAFCYFAINSGWTGNVFMNEDEKYFKGPWFGLFQVKDEHGYYIQYNVSVDANPFYVAKVHKDLEDFDMLPVIRGADYYEDSKGNTIVDNPLQRKLAEELIGNACLS